MRFGLVCVALAACGGKSDEAGKAKDKEREGPIRIAFGDCTGSPLPFVSGPRPLPPQAEEGERVAGAESAGAASEAADPAAADPAGADPAGAKAAKRTSVGVLRVLGTGSGSRQGGAFASLTGTGDIASGFDDANIYGGLLGSDQGGGGGGTGWGTIGTGRYGTIGHGSSKGYGLGGRAQRTTGPTVSIGQPTAQGSLDKAIIRRYIKRNLQKVQYCYEKQLLANPKLAGTVVAQFFIDSSGKVITSAASGVDPDVASCVAEVIKVIEFPRPKEGGVRVSYPFIFRTIAGGSAAPAAAAASSSGSAAAPDSGSAAAVSPTSAPTPAPAQAPKVAAPYQPGAHDPLRQVEPQLAACLRGATFGAMVVDLELDASTGQAIRATPGTTDSKLAACIADAAKTVKLEKPGPRMQRCGFAYGEMPAASVPTIAITAADVAFNGNVVDHPSNVLADASSWKIAALFEALDTWRKQPAPQGTVPIRGPGLIEPIDATPMKIVTHTLATAYAASTDFVLAAQYRGAWVPLRNDIVRPVAPVPVGSGGTWSGMAMPRDGRPAEPGQPDERVWISVLVEKERIWVGLSRINEFHEVPGRDWTKLDQVLRDDKASAFFVDRNEIEIAGDDDVIYGDVVKAIEVATKVGFTEWKVLPPQGLAARPSL